MSADKQDEVSVLVFLQVKPELEDEFLRLLTPVLDAMRHEPTFVSAALHRSPDEPASFMLYEVWADRDDLINVQMKREYRRAYEARLPDLLRQPRRAEVWRRMRADFTFFAGA
jgi:quinol monooxygenase YgiN